jgi:hypothetical protein
VIVAQNAADGIFTRNCAVFASRSTFRGNGGKGIDLVDTNGSIDQALITGNQTGAISFDSGVFSLTNSFVFRNTGGISFFSQNTGNRFEFNTIVDNAGSVPGVACNSGSEPSSHPNNIIARNTPSNTSGNTCTYPSSLVLDGDVTALKFTSPDAAPYDYHLGAGSIAIDAATVSTLDHDFDGQPRSSPRDVGADEYVP